MSGRPRASLLILALAAGPVEAASPRELLLRRELELVTDRAAVEDARLGLLRERESSAFVAHELTEHARTSLSRVEAYRTRVAERRARARVLARSLHRTARGGSFASVLAKPDGFFAAQRLRALVRHEVQELAGYRRAVDRTETELVQADRELQAVAAFAGAHELARHVLAALDPALDRELERTRSDRRSLAGAPTETDRELMARVADVGSKLALGADVARARPVAGAIVGRFGAYRDRVVDVPLQRDGVELRARRRELVRAVAAGRVTAVGRVPGFDEVVVIDHGQGLVSVTGRLQAVAVAVGRELAAGAELGQAAPKSLDDGLGPTVYFELRHGERPIDPVDVLPP